MRFYRLPTTDGIASLTAAEGGVPRPGRGQVLVRLRAASLNYRDLLVIRGAYGAATPPGVVPLSDGAGEVVEVGEEVSRVRVGDRVAGIFAQSWLAGPLDASAAASALGGAIDGVLSEYRLFDQSGLVHIPEHLSFEEAATLPCAAVTAWNALFCRQPLLPGQRVLLLGTGGVSVFALQLARLAGAEVIITSSSDEKLAVMKDLGASACINYRQRPEWQDEVRRLTGGEGVDHVVEIGGAGTLARSIASTRVGGQVHLIGVLTAGELNPRLLMQHRVEVRPVFVGSRQMFEDMNRAISLHGLRPVVHRVFPFEEAAEAYRYLESAAHLGKIVIRIG